MMKILRLFGRRSSAPVSRLEINLEIPALLARGADAKAA